MTYSFCSFLIGLLGLSSGIIGKTISSRKKKKLEEGLNNEELESSA